MPSSDIWVVVFDYRSDKGALLVGPFVAKPDAHWWLGLQQFDYEATVRRVKADPGTRQTSLTRESSVESRNCVGLLEDAYCFYCDKQYKTPSGLKKHVQTKHPGTYRDDEYKRNSNLTPSNCVAS